MTPEEKKYFAWLWALKKIGIVLFNWTDSTIPCPKSWKHFFDDGVGPLDALKIDLSEQ
jgi:hypothetical protein